MASSPLLRVALTGGIASGKSYVLQAFGAHGVPTIDADLLARTVVAPGTSGLAAIVERFGPDVLTPEGTLDRSRLGQQIFTDDQARRDLERIIHPAVYHAIEAWFARLDESGARLGVADIPLLFETGHEHHFQRIVVTSCPREVQIARLITRDHLSRAEAELRLATQWSIDQKTARADFVVHTDGPCEATNRQVADVVDALRAGAQA
ncbi:MAG: dephospho-CoA kinase [Luteitalea sp.]|nr:dephospho-CoA kinase [Luteitalea sp.]